MNRIIKLPSVEGGNFTSSNNRVTFRLPGGMLYKLDNGFINLYTTVNTTEDVAPGVVGVYDLEWVYQGQPNYVVDNVAVVKNASMLGRRVGYLEDIRQVGKLQAHLKQYEENSEMQEGMRFRELGQIYRPTQLKSTIHRELTKEGTQPSRELRTPIRIPLNKLFRGVTGLPYLPTDKLGDVDVNIELDLGKLSVKSPSLLSEFASLECEDSSGNVNTLQTKATRTAGDDQTFLTLEHSPFWVGQKVEVDGSGIAADYYLIEGIVYNDDKTITLTLDSSLPAGPITDLTVKPHELPANNYSVVYDYAELQVEQLAQAPEKMPSVITYTTFTTEEHSTGGNVAKYNKIFQCEPQAVNMMVLFNSGNNPFISHTESSLTGQNLYRVSINNDPLTNRDVKFHDPLHLDLVNKTFLNAGLSLRNLNEIMVNSNGRTLDDRVEDSKSLEIIMAPLPLTPMEKQVQVNVEFEAPASFNQMTLYKQVIKEIKL